MKIKRKLLRCLSPVLVVVLIVLCSVSALAAPMDYNDYITDINVDGDKDLVSVSLPVNRCHWACYGFPSADMIDSSIGNPATFPLDMSHLYEDTGYRITCFALAPDMLLINNIPDGSVFNFGVQFTTSAGSYNTPTAYVVVEYRDINSNVVGFHTAVSEQMALEELTEFSFTLDKPAGAYKLSFNIRFDNFYLLSPGEATFNLSYLNADISISSLYRLQEQTGKTNELLTQVEKQLEANGQTLEDVLQQQQQTNDKLDDTNNKLETLPGEIGDEMQGVIDAEKDEAKGEGNKFVEQILDALPDPSQNVLATLKGLTDATAYTGTDAVLPIPAIVLPGIDGLFPETEIWGGTQFDFGKYIALLPSSLLTLVQSLFTIAIVLFCVYELKGIISYCLTLRESKGG